MYWGDNHRHSCDLSWDGHGDPLLKQTLFYSLDWLGHDFICPSDHAERYGRAEWAWVPKFAMLYDVPGRFRVFAGYERSMRAGAGGGDQNCLYRDPLDFTEASAGYPSNSTWHDMYAAQSGIDVLAVPHTSAECGAVHKWNVLANGDPLHLAPPLRLVEVYQSARESFEYWGCPRQFPGCVAPPESGWVNVALATGMRLGLISASDHTIRAAFIGVLAENNSRDAIWQALWDRRTVGTGRAKKAAIEFRVAGALQGGEVESDAAPVLSIRIDCDTTLAKITVNKDGDPDWFVQTVAGDTTLTFTDPDPFVVGTSSYYYVRAEDAIGRLYWSSPVWVDFTEPPIGTGVDVAAGAAEEITLVAAPNPAAGPVQFAATGVAESGGVLRVYDVSGRLIRRLDLRGGQRLVEWDGEDRDGRRVSAGAMFAVLESAGRRTVTKLVRAR
jgi:hypothetical protein